MISSIAAGNYTIIKPSIGDKDRHLNKIDKLIIDILKQSIDSKRGLVLDDDQDVLKLIENHNVDLVFTMKTNSDPILQKCGEAGVKVIEYSAGWNVGIVSRFANVKEAAELLIHNKFYKSGQHLQNVDIIYVDKSVYNLFLIEAKNALYKFYTSLGQKNLNYGTIASKKDFFKILEILNDSHLDSK